MTSPALLAEFGRVLTEKFEWEPSSAEAAVRQVVQVSTVVRPLKRIEVIADDPDDDRVLEAADEGGADVIISGDRHLTHLGTWGEIRIERVSSFLKRLG